MKEKNVLLIIGEQSRRETLAARLRRMELVVNAVNDGEAALDISRKQTPDIAVVDFILPTMAGTALVTALRAEHGNTFPILVLTDARTPWQGMVDVTKAGADETLHEADNQELEPRVMALLHRWNQPTTLCGPIHLDNRTRTAKFEGRLLDLTAYEYKILEYLVAHAGQRMSGVSVVEHLYKQEYDRGPGVVDTVAEFVELLGKKMDPEGTRRPIEISDQGYRISCK